MSNAQIWRVTGKDHHGRRLAYMCIAATGREAIRKTKESNWWKYYDSPRCLAKPENDINVKSTFIVTDEFAFIAENAQ